MFNDLVLALFLYLVSLIEALSGTTGQDQVTKILRKSKKKRLKKIFFSSIIVILF